MRIVGVFLCVVVVASDGYAQEQDAETALGESLKNAIVAEDIVAYSQCWTSARQGIELLKSLGVEIPAEEIQEMRKYGAKRNQNIAKSFYQIQKLITDRKIDRKTIQLKSCKAQGVRKEKTPKGNLQSANSFTMELTVGDEVWKMTIDDGALLNGLWYFSDSPISLKAGKSYLSFQEPETPKEQK